jgi:glycosyltransferase involved in cell wall biosynthesis
MNASGIHISIVTPSYLCGGCISELHRRLTETLKSLPGNYEIIIVEDGSPANDWEIISEICARDKRVVGIKLSRNYGQHFAITAGLDHARGDLVVVMDCDLQDRPEDIPKLYAKAQEGHDVVFARRAVRHESLYRRWSSDFFTLFYNYLGDIKADNSTSNFSISSRRVIDYVRQFRERNRSFPLFLNLVGFHRAFVDVGYSDRFAGKSSYTFGKLLDFAVQCIVSQSNKPLRLSIRFGFALALASIFYGGLILVRYFIYSVSVPGWTSLIVLMCLLGGLGFANLGILGMYLGKVFDEVKNRPLYSVAEIHNARPADPVRDS